MFSIILLSFIVTSKAFGIKMIPLQDVTQYLFHTSCFQNDITAGILFIQEVFKSMTGLRVWFISLEYHTIRAKSLENIERLSLSFSQRIYD